MNHRTELADKLADKSVRISYNYCRICGRVPEKNDEPNYAPIKFWEPDDGWFIGTLCFWCWDEAGDRQPEPEDYAYEEASAFPEIETDEDPFLALE